MVKLILFAMILLILCFQPHCLAQPALTPPDLSGYAQIRYVSVNTGSDTTGDGSQAKPWMTLTHAINRISNESQTNKYALIVASGTYNEGSTITLTPWIDLYGGYNLSTWLREEQAGSTILAGNNSRTVVYGASNTLIDGFLITGAKYKSDGLYYLSSLNAIIRNCIISKNAGHGLFVSDSSSLTLLNSEITENGNTGISVYNNSSASITNCIIARNYSSESASGIVFSNNVTFNMTSSTILGNRSDRTATLACYSSLLCSVTNCIIWNPGEEVLVSGVLSITYSCIQGGYSGVGNINEYPLFEDSANGDYHLKDGSPCIGHANLNECPDTDIEGNSRPGADGEADMGALETPDSYHSGSYVSPTRFYVSSKGNKGSIGDSWLTACTSVSNVLEYSTGTAEIWVAAGIYNESIILEKNTKIYGGFSGIETFLNERDWVHNKTIINASGTGRGAVSVYDQSEMSGFTITGGQGSQFGGIKTRGSDIIVTNCVVTNNTGTDGGGIYISGNPTIRNCVISNNQTTSRGTIYLAFSRPHFEHCTIVGNTAGEKASSVFCNFSHPVFMNCILWNNGQDIYADKISSISATSCCIQNGYPGTGNISQYPQFTDPFNGDYHLKAGSPCIDSGSQISSITSDLEGNIRPGTDSLVDIGAYEMPAELVPSPRPQPTRLHVNIKGPSGGDGATWDSAYRTIKDALWYSSGGEEIWVASGTYTQPIALEFTTKLYGGFSGSESALSERTVGSATTMIDVSGTGARAILGNEGILMDHLTIMGADTDMNGGGVYLDNVSSATISDCTFKSCKASYGGGVACINASVNITKCSFIGNNATYGGGLYQDLFSNVNLSNTLFFENVSTKNGGGIYCSVNTSIYEFTEGFIHIERCVLSDNKSPYGGALYSSDVDVELFGSTIKNNSSNGVNIRGNASALIQSCTFENNLSSDGGAGLCLHCYSSIIENSVFQGNQTTEAGGGLSFDLGVIPAGVNAMTDCLVTNNNSLSNGGGITCESGAILNLHRVRILGNKSQHYGGGLALSINKPSEIVDCVISDNYSKNAGGGIYLGNLSSVFKNCVISDNISSGEGGGVYTSSTADPAFYNCVITNNTGGLNGAIWGYTGAKLSLLNSIIWKNHPNEINTSNFTVTLTNCAITGGWTGDGTSNIDSDPLFVNAAAGDFHLQSTSPCINMGIGPSANSSVPVTDIDGDPRSGATCDIGADEFVAPTLILEWVNY